MTSITPANYTRYEILQESIRQLSEGIGQPSPAAEEVPVIESAPVEEAAVAPAMLAMPQTISLKQLADLNPKMQIVNPIPATFEQIQDAVDKRQFHCLKELFDHTAAFEFQKNEYDSVRRAAFIQGFTELHKYFKNHFPRDPEIIQFAKGGRGAEVLYLLAKVPFFPQFNDPEYGARIMVFAKGQVHFRPTDFVPGVNRPLRMIKPNCGKEDIALEESPFLPELTNRIEEVKTQIALPRILAVSQLISPQFTQPKGTVYVRGIPCSGKSTYLAKEWQVPEDLLVDTDSLRLLYGGDGAALWQHVAARTMDLLAEEDTVNYTVVNKTNLYPHNIKAICTPPPPGSETIVCDFVVDLQIALKRATGRAAAHPDRAILSDEEMKELYDRSANSRWSIIKTALANPRFEWRLIDNNGQAPEIIASIVNQKLNVFNNDALNKLCAMEPASAAALEIAEIKV